MADVRADLQEEMVKITRYNGTDIYEALKEPLKDLVAAYNAKKSEQYWSSAKLDKLPLDQLIDEKITDTAGLKSALESLRTDPSIQHGAVKIVHAVVSNGVEVPIKATDTPFQQASAQSANHLLQYFLSPAKVALGVFQSGVQATLGLTPETQAKAAVDFLGKTAPLTKIQHIIELLDLCFQMKTDENCSAQRAIKITKSRSEKHAPSEATWKRWTLGTDVRFESAFYIFCLAVTELIENIELQKKKVVEVRDEKDEENGHPGQNRHDNHQKLAEMEASLAELQHQVEESRVRAIAQEKQHKSVLAALENQMQQQKTEALEKQAQAFRDQLASQEQQKKKQLEQTQATHQQQLQEKDTQIQQQAEELTQIQAQNAELQTAASVSEQGLFSGNARRALHLKYGTGILLGLAAESAACIFYLGMISTAYVSIPIAFALLSLCAGVKLYYNNENNEAPVVQGVRA